MDLVIAIAAPTREQVRAVQTGRVSIGVHIQGVPTLDGQRPEVRLLFRVAGLAREGDAPCSLDLVPETERPDLAPLAAGSRYRLTLVLVYAGAGRKVRAIRRVSLSPDLSEALRATVVGERRVSVPLEEAGA